LKHVVGGLLAPHPPSAGGGPPRCHSIVNSRGIRSPKQSVRLALYYPKVARYSIHALAGAVETRERFRDLSMRLAPDEEDLLGVLGDHSDDLVIVGISFTSARAVPTRALVQKIRSAVSSSQRLFLLAGGPHPTGFPEDALRIGFDAAVYGEGEETFLELLERIEDGKDWRETRGIAFLDERGDFHQTPPRPALNLDDYPPFPVRLRRFGHIEITRGCPFACAFCQSSHLHGFRPRHRGVENVCRHIASMRAHHRTDYRFITPNAFGYGSEDGRKLNVEAVRDLLREARRTAGDAGRIYFGTFPSEVRPEHVCDETVQLVREFATNDNLILGAQTGSERLLRECRRGHSVEEVRRAVDCILRAGLGANVDFIFGLPGETEEDRRATIEMMRELAAKGARIHTHTFMPVPQTPFASAPPGRIAPVLREALHHLIPAGAAYGNWREQEALARRMVRGRK
jgi:B12-binding domain/radical SAM domain protein